MTIADISNLPTITIKVTGREATATKCVIINQETKVSLEMISGFTFTQNETATITIDSESIDFIESIDEYTTLSVLFFDSANIPLYRDIVRFNQTMGGSGDYVQDSSSDTYIIYGTEYNPSIESSSVNTNNGAGSSSGGSSSGGSVPVTTTPTTQNQTYIAVNADETIFNFDATPLTETNEYSINYDSNNSGRGQMFLSSGYIYTQAVEETQGDFKVRSAQYGVFNSTPSSLEVANVFAYGFNTNTGNTYGYHPSSQDGRNPNLVNTLEKAFPAIGRDSKYYHFRNGRDETFSDLISYLQTRQENGLDNSSLVNLSQVYKEDSISDWTVGMSIYSDAEGTSITDNYVDSYADINDLDRYHFISKNSSNVWVLERCTDGIVTHIEALDSVDYVRMIEMYEVRINSTVSFTSAGSRLSDYRTWLEGQLALQDAVFSEVGSGSFGEYTSSRFGISRISYYRGDFRRAFDMINGTIGAVGDKIYRSKAPLNSLRVFHKTIVSDNGNSLYELDENQYARYRFSAFANKRKGNEQFQEQPWLLIEFDRVTGLISDRQWINPSDYIA